MSSGGIVTLIGAGPGDPGLLTVAGRQALEAAEVVLYDRLVGEELLDLVPAKAQRVDVGKAKGRHLLPQEEINRLLLDHVKQGKRVVRLKGGDPYLFGRGAEELELLERERIPFRVIPGITSALSVPCYAGIPITHREYASSVHILTGHGKDGTPPNLPYDELVKLSGTLVFLMGVSSLAAICTGLMAAGMRSDMPAALVQNGTRPNQRKLVTMLGRIADQAISEEFAAPSVLVVGPVVELSDRFDWTDRLPLWGVRLVAAGTRATGTKLTRLLRALGGHVTEYPCVRQEPLADDSALWDRLDDYRWIAFTSRFAVDLFFDRLLKHKRDIRALAPIKFAVVGRETAGALLARGVLADYMPEQFDGRSLAIGLSPLVQPGEKVLLYRAENGMADLPETLAAHGVGFTDLAAYRTVSGNAQAQLVQRKLEAGEIDAVTFTSASSVHGFAGSMPDLDYSNVQALCIGQATASAALGYGMQARISREATVDGMAELALEQFSR